MKDSTTMLWDGPSGIDLRGAMYLTTSNPDYSGDLVFTTIYGLDPNPASSGLSVFGFDPLPLAGVPSISDERIIGDSGTQYPATIALTPTLADLPALLPGFDLSPFGGSPSSTFYLFQTTAPGADFAIVPEPSTLVLGLAGLALIGLVARRRG